MIQELRKLTLAQSVHLNLFLLKQVELTQARRIQTLTRGDNLENLFTKLNVFYDRNNPDYTQLLEKLFMVGEKGKHFYADQLLENNRTNNFRIDECSPSALKSIFDNLNESVKNKNPQNVAFFASNQKFKLYFQDKKTNKRSFVDAILSSGIKEQLYFRNYYLTLLHQLGAFGYRDNSHLVSTTRNPQIARKFAGARSVSEKIKIHLWQPVVNQKVRFERYSLPRYKGKPYTRQQEVSLLAGIFPQYISSVE